jgi:hypothetical protein
MSYDYGDDDDVVVNREGGYYGGGIAMPGFVSKTALSVGRFFNSKVYGKEYDNDYMSANWTAGYVILLLIIVLILLWWFGWLVGTYSGMHGSDMRFLGGSQPGVSTFMNNRDAPYFPDVTNDVLRREDMEAEAVRALAKINQERVRRAPPSDSAPLEWGPFWDEWRQTHGSSDYSAGIEGFDIGKVEGGVGVY